MTTFMSYGCSHLNTIKPIGSGARMGRQVNGYTFFEKIRSLLSDEVSCGDTRAAHFVFTDGYDARIFMGQWSQADCLIFNVVLDQLHTDLDAFTTLTMLARKGMPKKTVKSCKPQVSGLVWGAPVCPEEAN